MHNPMMAQLEDFRPQVFRAAAGRLFLMRSAVTLGVRSFDCAGERVSSTRQGSVLLTYANEAAAMVSEASTLYRRPSEDTLALATSLTSVEVALMCPEQDQGEWAHVLGNTVHVVAKKGEGLAAGLTFVSRHFTAGAGQQAILQNCSALRPHREQRSGSNGGVMQ